MELSLPIYRALHCRDESPPHCQTCRADRDWRRSLVAHYRGAVDYECPIGLPIVGDVTDETLPPPPPRSPQPHPAQTRAKPEPEPLTPEQVAAREAAAKLSWIEAAKRIKTGLVAGLLTKLGIGVSVADVAAARLAVCQNCPSNLFRPCLRGTRRCCGAILTGDTDTDNPGCGCILAVVEKGYDEAETIKPAGKLMRANHHCPKNYW